MITFEKTFVIKMTINNCQIEELFKLCKYSFGDKGFTKQDFISYIKCQLTMFGTDGDSLIGNTSDYPKLTESELILLDRWSLS
jgi:hypothetical protein